MHAANEEFQYILLDYWRFWSSWSTNLPYIDE